MKKIILFAISCALCFACSKPEYPTFKYIANPKILKLSTKKVMVEADVVMNNPNNIEIEMTAMDVNIYANEVHVGQTNQTKSSVIGAKKNFSIPISFDFSPKEVFNLKGLGGLINALNNKTVDLKYEGAVSVKLANKIVKIPFTYEDTLPLKKEQPDS